MRTQEIVLKGQHLILHPLKAVFWVEGSALIFSDLHFGKAGHFRKNGVPIPHHIHADDLKKIAYLLDEYNPEKIIIVGDLFHSDLNSEWQIFETFVKSRKEVGFVLVKGNHDILHCGSYKSTLKCVDYYELPPFSFSHKQNENNKKLYNISGHIHPSVNITGKSRQSIRVECFYFSENFAVLPSFGNFTGNYKISAKFGDLIYLIVEDQIIAFNPLKCNV